MADVPDGVILGLGNPLLDISVFVNNELLEKYGLLPNNAIIAEERHHAMFDELVEKHQPEYIPGGATQNTIRIAQWILQKENATTFFGGIGDDDFGKVLYDKLQQFGVNVRYQVHTGMKTGVCGALITGENRSLVSELGAAMLFNVDYLKTAENWKCVEMARCFYVGGFILPVSPLSAIAIAKHAAEHDKILVMNLHATFLCKYFVSKDLNLMPYIDILFGNSDEAAEFCKQYGISVVSVKEMASQIAALPKRNLSRDRIVVITQGSEPTVVAHSGKLDEYPVLPIDPSLIKDTNGCGDSFVGGFLSQLVQGKSLDECVKCGSYAARVIIQHYGCTYPDKPDF